MNKYRYPGDSGPAPPRARGLGLFCAFLILLMVLFWQGLLMFSSYRFGFTRQPDDAATKVAAWAMFLGMMLPYVCFIRTIVWLLRSFPLPARLVWWRCCGACLGGLAGVGLALAATRVANLMTDRGVLVFVGAGMLLPPLLACLGETLALRWAKLRGARDRSLPA